jgi:hypothetical protein
MRVLRSQSIANTRVRLRMAVQDTLGCIMRSLSELRHAVVN